MKKAASLLLVITLFTSLFYNVVEYYMLVSYQKEQNWVASMQNTPESAFKVIKLNATLYTFIEDSDLEKVNENVIIDNKIYHIFKKQIKDNVLNLYYLGDENQNAIDVSLKKIVDYQSNSQSNNSPIEKLIKSFSKDYLENNFNSFAFNTVISYKPNLIFNNQEQKLQSGYLNLNIPPPKLV